MKRRTLGIYLSELDFQSRCALNGFASLEKSYQQMRDNGIKQVRSEEIPTDDFFVHQRVLMDEFFRTIQSILTHASNISRLLWPPRPLRRGLSEEKYRALCNTVRIRGEILRTTLSVPIEHPLADRQARDDLDHFDARIDEWANEPDRNWINLIVGPLNGIQGLPDRDRIRWVDPTTWTVVVWGREYNFKSLAQEIKQLQDSCVRERRSLDEPSV